MQVALLACCHVSRKRVDRLSTAKARDWSLTNHCGGRTDASSVGHAERGVMLSAPFHLACFGSADDMGPSQAIMLQHAPMPKTAQALCSRPHLPYMSYG